MKGRRRRVSSGGLHLQSRHGFAREHCRMVWRNSCWRLVVTSYLRCPEGSWLVEYSWHWSRDSWQMEADYSVGRAQGALGHRHQGMGTGTLRWGYPLNPSQRWGCSLQQQSDSVCLLN